MSEYLRLAEDLSKLRSRHTDFPIDPIFVQAVIDGVCAPKTQEIIDPTINHSDHVRNKLDTIATTDPDLSHVEIVDTYIGREFIIPGLRSADRLYRPDKPRDFIVLHDTLQGAVFAAARMLLAEGNIEIKESDQARLIAAELKKAQIKDESQTLFAELYLWIVNDTKSLRSRFLEDGVGFLVLDDVLETFECSRDGGTSHLQIPTPLNPPLFVTGVRSYRDLYKAISPLVA